MMNDHASSQKAAAATAAASPRPLGAATKAVVTGIVLIVFIGVIDAVANLPVITGCAFYGQCGWPSDPPTELDVSPVE